jgi:hypothetical protein
MTEPSAAARIWRSRLLDYLDGYAADMVAGLAGLVQVPSISGTAEENAIQGVLSARLAGARRRQPRARAPRVSADRRNAHGHPCADPHRTRALRGPVKQKPSIFATAVCAWCS